MRDGIMDLLIIVSMVIVFGVGYWLGFTMNREHTPTTCPTIGVVVINDALVIVRECADGSIVRDFPWQD